MRLAILTAEQRAQVDEKLCGDHSAAAAMSDGQLVGQARRMAQRLDPAAAVRRASRAARDRTVTIRPMPDTMTLVSAVLPVGQGVELYAALREEAASLTSGATRGPGTRSWPTSSSSG